MGTDGFGRSDTRAALRRHFEVDAEHIAWTTLVHLHRAGQVDSKVLQRAMTELDIDPDKVDPASA